MPWERKPAGSFSEKQEAETEPPSCCPEEGLLGGILSKLPSEEGTVDGHQSGAQLTGAGSVVCEKSCVSFSNPDDLFPDTFFLAERALADLHST